MSTPEFDIFVAEDDSQIAKILLALLDHEGFSVKHAEDGMAARKFIASNPPPRLVLLDIMMPYVDGFQLVQEIRAKPDWLKVPVAMLTAKSQEKDVIRAIKSGANEYIVKPFQPAELLARIKRLMGN